MGIVYAYISTFRFSGSLIPDLVLLVPEVVLWQHKYQCGYPFAVYLSIFGTNQPATYEANNIRCLLIRIVALLSGYHNLLLHIVTFRRWVALGKRYNDTELC